MKNIIMLGVLILCLARCTTVRKVEFENGDGNAARSLNLQAAKSPAKVTFRDGHTEYVRQMWIEGETASWINANLDVVSRPAHEIAQVEFANRGKGALQGIGIGLLSGFVTGAVVGLISGDDECEQGFCWFTFTAEQKAISYGAVIGISAGAVGGLVGVGKGSKDYYRFPAYADSTSGRRGVARWSTTDRPLLETEAPQLLLRP